MSNILIMHYQMIYAHCDHHISVKSDDAAHVLHDLDARRVIIFKLAEQQGELASLSNSLFASHTRQESYTYYIIGRCQANLKFRPPSAIRL
jgi:hypothetical protein